MPPLQTRVALVTGTSAPNGIGRAIALRLARDGASVVVADLAGADGGVDGGADDTRSRDALQQDLVAGLNRLGADALAVPLDVTDETAVKSAIARTVERFGRLDILVNNAGSLAGAAPFLTTTPAQWDTSFRVNLLGPMMLTQAAIPEMIASGGGRIVNIGSTGSLGAEPGFGAYTAMKHALTGLTKTVAAEFGPDGILCNLVCPGYIATDMHEAANRRLAEERGQTLGETRAQRYRAVALRRAGRPEEVADAVAYLAGPQGSYVTGITLPISGGVPFGI